MAKLPVCDVCGKSTRKGTVVGSIFACQKCLQEAQDPVEENTAESFSSKLKKSKKREIRITSGKTPTPEQVDLLEKAMDMPKVLVVKAGAGTGKTTSLRMLADVLIGRGQYTAFNKPLVMETKPKFNNTNVSCDTTHALAFRNVGKDYAHRLGGARMKSEHVAKLLGIEVFEIPFGEETRRLAPGFLAGKCLDAIRRFCQSADPRLDVSHFRYIDGIDNPSENGKRVYDNNQKVREYLLPFAKKAWDDINSPDGQLTFTHDHYVKIWQLGKPVISANYILLDEAQDTAPVMLDILRQQTCTVILVGDDAQQIYEWRGAVNAMTYFGEAPIAYLSQSFRFGQAIADVANAVLETFDEPTELRLKGLASIPSTIGPLDNPTAILCRTNACAVGKYLNAITDGKNPFLVGGGADVIAFMKAAKELQTDKPTSHPDLACFSNWAEVQEYSKMDEGEDLRLMVKLIDAFGVDTIMEALKRMPLEKNADLVISTAHKSKGREWDDVQIAHDFPTKSKCSDAERKLLYVGVTRAKKTLDVSLCPFFTGDDSLDIDRILAAEYKPQEISSIVPPASSTPPASAEFTWSKDKISGRWNVRGPNGHSGEYVDVTRKDGSVSSRLLRRIIEELDDLSIYEV